MSGFDAQSVLMEWKVAKRDEIAGDYALEIATTLGEATEITSRAVIQAIGDLNKSQEGKIYPTLEQVLSALKNLDINIVEETLSKVEAACEDLSPLYVKAATQVAFIVKAAGVDGAATYLEALKVKQDEIKRAIKSLKPSGAILSAEKVYEALIKKDPRVASIRGGEAAKAFFIETFKD